MHKLTVAQGTALSAGAVLGAGVIALPAVADAHLRQARELLNTPLQLEHRALASEPQPALSR